MADIPQTVKRLENAGLTSEEIATLPLGKLDLLATLSDDELNSLVTTRKKFPLTALADTIGGVIF